ncbi:MAG: C40 family peptidase [Syntrophales bacterium LBB04]|nr:C40 family peptidase [Syntrophales bacterium LBB04]
MRTLRFMLPLGLVFAAWGVTVHSAAPQGGEPGSVDFWPQVRARIETHLNRPYVWGASGLKSFDCSGFLWRVMFENGTLIKRTTARKFFMCLPEVSQEQAYSPGNVVFFDDLRHCGIVADRKTFYHAESSIGTNLSRFDPYWRPKVYGFRALPKEAP